MNLRATAARLLRRTANRLDSRQPRISLALTRDIGAFVSGMNHRDHVHMDNGHV